jgi:hypothetical protein
MPWIRIYQNHEIQHLHLIETNVVQKQTGKKLNCEYPPNPTKQSPSWEAGSNSASQEIPCLSWNQTVHYYVHKRLPFPMHCATLRNQPVFTNRTVRTSELKHCKTYLEHEVTHQIRCFWRKRNTYEYLESLSIHSLTKGQHTFTFKSTLQSLNWNPWRWGSSRIQMKTKMTAWEGEGGDDNNNKKFQYPNSMKIPVLRTKPIQHISYSITVRMYTCRYLL